MGRTSRPTPPSRPRCPRCGSNVVRPVLPSTDSIDLRCEDCGVVWAVPLPPRARRVARFTMARFNVWRSSPDRRRRPR